jgi:hypothetical protein
MYSYTCQCKYVSWPRATYRQSAVNKAPLPVHSNQQTNDPSHVSFPKQHKFQLVTFAFPITNMLLLSSCLPLFWAGNAAGPSDYDLWCWAGPGCTARVLAGRGLSTSHLKPRSLLHQNRKRKKITHNPKSKLLHAHIY